MGTNLANVANERSGLVESVRRLPVRVVCLGAFAVAMLTVLTALPGRWGGDFSCTDKYVPLRPLTVDEGAFLLAGDTPKGVIVSLDDDSVVLASDVYLLPRGPERAGKSDDYAPYGGDVVGRYLTAPANWNGFSSIYRLPRRELESALGRRVQPSEVEADYVAGHPVSFSPEQVPRYVVTEVAFLAVWLALAFLLFRRIRRISAVLPLMVGALVAPAGFVAWYSPAFLDADFFHQRVVIEAIALCCVVAAYFLAVPAGISLVVYVTLRLAEVMGRAFGAEAAFRRRASRALLLVAMVYLLARYGRYRIEARGCAADLALAAARVSMGSWLGPILGRAEEMRGEENLMKSAAAGPEIRDAIEGMLGEDVDDPRRSLVVFAPVPGRAGEYLFLWRNGFLFADFRAPGPRFGNQINAEQLAMVEESGRYATGFLRSFRGNHVCGCTVDVEGREVIVVVEEKLRMAGVGGLVLW